MPATFAAAVSTEEIDALPATSETTWLWNGYVARGNITLLTSLWKAGKTTLVSGLLQRLVANGTFLDRVCTSAKSIVISEESLEQWSARLKTMPLGKSVRILSRPFLARPSPQAWCDLIDEGRDLCVRGELDLLVVDPLAAFLPGRSDSDPATVLDFLQPLQRLAASGAAVLVLHHPRKRAADEGNAARGTGALLGYVDFILELHRFGRTGLDDRRRKLIGLSRRNETPRYLTYVWSPPTGEFSTFVDTAIGRFDEYWPVLRSILERHESALAHQELLREWPDDQPLPPIRVLYAWLNRAYDAKLIRREGTGRKDNPFRYRLPNEDDPYYDRGELPPLRPLFGGI